MTTWIEANTQALQSWFHQLGLSSFEALIVDESEGLSQPDQNLIAASQNLWLQALKTSTMPLYQAIELGTGGDWLNLGQGFWRWVHESTFGTLAHIPLIGSGRELSQKLLQTFEAWAQLYPSSMAYQIVLVHVQTRSFEVFLDALIDLTAKGEALKDGWQLQQIWCRVADQVFEQALSLDDALRARGQFLNAKNYHKLCQQELMEISLTQMNMPTRREVDELHRTVYELRKEVKRLKKALPGDTLNY